MSPKKALARTLPAVLGMAMFGVLPFTAATGVANADRCVVDVPGAVRVLCSDGGYHNGYRIDYGNRDGCNGCGDGHGDGYVVPGDKWFFLATWDDGRFPPPGYVYFDTGYGRAYVCIDRPQWAGNKLWAGLGTDGKVYVKWIWG